MSASEESPSRLVHKMSILDKPPCLDCGQLLWMVALLKTKPFILPVLAVNIEQVKVPISVAIKKSMIFLW